MAWIKVQLVDEGPLTETRSKDLSVRATVWTKWYVESDAAVTQDQCLAATIAGGNTVPALGASYSTSRPHCRVRRRRVEKETSHKGFVVCEYEDPTDGSSIEALPSKAARITSRPEMQMEGYTVDTEGTPALNAAGEPFDNPPMKPAGIRVYTIKKYVNATVKGQIKAAWNTNNSGPFSVDGDSWLADEGWLFDYSFEGVDGSSSWDATIVIKCKEGGWADKVLNVGFRQANGREIRINRSTGAPDMENGERPSVAWPLDSFGAAKTGSPPVADTITLYPIGQHAWTGVPLS